MSAHILGSTSSQPHCELPQSYFEERDCWVDCRVPDMLHISREANIGWCVNLICMTHDIDPGMFGRLTGRRIIIHPKAFVAGFCTLYNCEIGEGAVVAVGSVVRSQKVEPWTVVAGNPAVVVKRLNQTTQKWEKVPPP